MTSNYRRYETVHSGVILLSEIPIIDTAETATKSLSPDFLRWIESLPIELKGGILRLSSRRLVPKPRYLYASFVTTAPMTDDACDDGVDESSVDEKKEEATTLLLRTICELTFVHLRLWADSPGSGLAVCYVMVPEKRMGCCDHHDLDEIEKSGFCCNGRMTFRDEVLIQFYYSSPMIGKVPKPLEFPPIGIAFGVRAAVQATVDQVSFVLVLFEQRTNAKAVLFPGGDKDVGVDAVTAAITELREECALRVCYGEETEEVAEEEEEKKEQTSGRFSLPIIYCGLLGCRYVGPWEIEYFPGNFLLTLLFDLGELEELPEVQSKEKQGLGCFWLPKERLLEESQRIATGESGIVKKNLKAIVENGFGSFPWSDFSSMEAFVPEKWCSVSPYDRKTAVAEECVEFACDGGDDDDGVHHHYRFRVVREGGENVHVPVI